MSAVVIHRKCHIVEIF